MKTDLFTEKKIIYLITDGTTTAENFSEKLPQTLNLIKAAVSNKISLIQIREKKLSAKLLFELALQASEITKKSETKLLINDRVDIALGANADGVHLTANSLSPRVIRENFPKNFLIGVSSHSLETAEIAKKEGADFAVLSPIFASPNKGKPLGLNNLSEVCKKLKPFPIIALGGIDEMNFREVLQFAAGFAAIRFLNNTENLQKLKNEGLFDDSRN